MSEIKYKVVRDYTTEPTQAYESAAGIDLYANLAVKEKDIDAIKRNLHLMSKVPDEGVLKVGTGIAVEIPKGYVGLLFPRSSFGLTGNALANAVGVIDSDYRGEICALVCRTWHNMFHGDSGNYIAHGQKFCQLVIVPVLESKLTKVDELSSTERGKSGFGSSGK